MRRYFMRLSVLFLIVTTTAMSLSARGQDENIKGPVVVASKFDTEGGTVGQHYALSPSECRVSSGG